VASVARTWRHCGRLPAPGRPPKSALGAREALALLLGHGLAAPQTARDFLEAFDEVAPPLWQGERSQVPGEGERLQGLGAANRRLIAFLQERAPQAVATIDLDATILESHKRSALATYDGRTGYQPVVALWAEQDVILADEFRDGNVPAGTGNRRLVERAVAALPPGVDQVFVRADSAGQSLPSGRQSRTRGSTSCCAGWRRAASATGSAPTCAPLRADHRGRRWEPGA